MSRVYYHMMTLYHSLMSLLPVVMTHYMGVQVMCDVLRKHDSSHVLWVLSTL